MFIPFHIVYEHIFLSFILLHRILIGIRTPGDRKTYLWAPPERGEATHGKEERFNLEAQSRSPDKATGIGQPKFGESHAQASEGNLHLPQTRSCAMAGVIHQPIACRSARLSHQLHEKG